MFSNNLYSYTLQKKKSQLNKKIYEFFWLCYENELLILLKICGNISRAQHG